MVPTVSEHLLVLLVCFSICDAEHSLEHKNVAVNRGYEAGCVLIEPAGRISSDMTFEYVRYAYYLLIFGFHT